MRGDDWICRELSQDPAAQGWLGSSVSLSPRLPVPWASLGSTPWPLPLSLPAEPQGSELCHKFCKALFTFTWKIGFDQPITLLIHIFPGNDCPSSEGQLKKEPQFQTVFKALNKLLFFVLMWVHSDFTLWFSLCVLGHWVFWKSATPGFLSERCRRRRNGQLRSLGQQCDWIAKVIPEQVRGKYAILCIQDALLRRDSEVNYVAN